MKTTKEKDRKKDFDDAFLLAHRLHRAQKRKGTNIPYISHLMAVAGLVLENGGTEDEAIAALLHDGPEDAGGEATLDEIRKRFGDPVATIVKDCSDSLKKEGEPKDPWEDRKRAHLAKMQKAGRSSVLVATADKFHNLRCILTDYRALEDNKKHELWYRFNAGRDATLWYYESFLAVAKERLDLPLVAEFERTFLELRRMVDGE